MRTERKSLLFIVSGVALTVALFILYVSFDVRRRNTETVSVEKVVPMVNQEREDIIIGDVTGDDPTIVDVVKSVSKHMVLPNGNVTVATVTNVENLRAIDPVFYERAQMGDKLLLYDDRAILYNPALDRILDVSHTITKASL